MFHIIDDEEYILDIMATMLKHLGHACRCFPHAQAYLDYVHSDAFEKPSAAFTDLNMPGMDGYRLMEKVNALYPDFPFIVITSDSEIAPAYADMVKDHLIKPFRVRTLASVIEAYVQDDASLSAVVA